MHVYSWLRTATAAFCWRLVPLSVAEGGTLAIGDCGVVYQAGF